jgi:hypothetical protein
MGRCEKHAVWLTKGELKVVDRRMWLLKRLSSLKRNQLLHRGQEERGLCISGIGWSPLIAG